MCSTASRIRANRLQFAVHDERINEAKRRMFKTFGKAAHNFETETLPQPDSPLVGADHEVELHGAKSALACSLQRVRTHRASHPAARSVRRRHVAAIGNVCATAFLI